MKCFQGMPRQDGSVLCGHFVMRFLKDIVEDIDLGFWKKVQVILCGRQYCNIFCFFGLVVMLV